MVESLSEREKQARLREVATIFLKLGTVGFGGPAAHIAMMNEEIVEKRKWVSRETFLDLLGATNLIPGPNSTELAIHLGYQRAGWLGLILAGTCFILPAMLIVLAFSIFYVAYGALPQVTGILYGIKPVIIAIVIHALWSLTKTAVKGRTLLLIGMIVAILAFLGVNEILLLGLAGVVAMLVRRIGNRKATRELHSLTLPLWSLALPAVPSVVGVGSVVAGASLSKLFLSFLKIGSVLYGSGYVLLAFLQSEFVDSWKVLTSEQLLDAVAIGQFTPGPVFTTATFVGYLVAGTPGAILSTIGIFLPAFVFVALVNPWIPRLRQSPVAGAVLDGVNVASLALMAVVTVQLGVASVVDVPTALLAVLATVLVFRVKINTAWLVLAGGVIGWLVSGL